jgi:hypothetical protein
LNLTLTYSEALSATTAAPANFVVTVNSTETRTISSVSASGSSITLALGSQIEAVQSIAVTYTDPTGGNDANAIQDLWGNDAATLSNQPITNTLNSTNDSAISLNGTNQSASASGAQVIPTSTASAFTVEAWIRQPASRSSTAFYQILSQGTSGNEFYIKVVDGSVKFRREGFSETTCNVRVPTEEWTHVAVVVGTTSQSCYINGSLAGSFTQSSTTAIGTTFAVGRYAPLGGEFFLGQIDEVKIWSDARTPSEIQSDLKTYGGTLADNLVAYYDFNDQSGPTLINRSTGGSSALNLTLFNSPALTSTEIFETSIVQAYTVVKFKRTFLVASGGWASPSVNQQMNYLVIGGGGAGGGGIGGGGGAGEFVESSTLVTSTTIIPVVVGVGGTPRDWIGGNAGQNSSFSSIIAYGGGGGGTNELNGPTQSQGPNLGSQGGGGYPNTQFTGSNPAPLFGIRTDDIGFNSIRFRNNGGAGSNGGGSQATGGGGGGAGGVGAPGTFVNAGNGGAGKSSAITGSTVFYAAGGGAGVNGASSPGFPASIAAGDPGVGGSGIGGNGGQEATNSGSDGYGNRGDGTNGTVDSRGTPGNANTGSGGGGASNWTLGGSGGSGIVVIRYITPPTIHTQPLSDTTTVGTVDTFTISTSIAIPPVTKSVQWQFTADTTTAVVANITGWTNLSAGTGITTDTFTTVAVTKAMNKFRYRAIVTFSDTATLSVQVTSSIAVLTVNDAITITSDTSTVTRKYGDTQTVRTISYVGGTTNTGGVGTTDSHTVRGQVGNLASGRIYVDTSTTTAVFRVDTRTVVGSYVETITVTDARGATASYVQRVVVTQADTLTIQADTLTAITFGGTLSPTATVTGLVPGDAVSSTAIGHISCANGGSCVVGDIGPGGGVVFHVITNTSDSQTAITGYTSGGIYLEAAPVGWGNGISVAAGETTGTSYLDPVVNWCNTAFDFNSKGAGIGQGGDNSKKMDANCSSGAGQIAVDLNIGGKDDWYLPSQDELTQMGVQKNLIGLLYDVNNCYGSTCYWSSTQNGGGSSVRGLDVVAGSETMRNYDTLLTASNQVMMRPIRAFSPITNNTETVTAGAPTAAGTYTLRPTAITLAEGVNTNNYVNVVYRSSSVTINRATQSPKISMQPASVAYDTGTATQALTATSGPGTGAVFYLIGAGSAATCSISGSTVRISADGVCNVVAYKQASTNYLADSATAVAITFTRFIPRPVQVQLFPSMIPLNQGNTLEKSALPQALLTITNVATTSSSSYTVTGTGFNAISIIRIGADTLAAGTNYTVTPTTITITNAAGMAGPLFIELSDGQAVFLFSFPNNPE